MCIRDRKDLEFISKKYPDMKQMAEESLKDYNNIIKELKLCKDHDEVEQLLFKFSKETSNTAKNGYLSDLQSKIKATIMEEMIKDVYKRQVDSICDTIKTYVLCNKSYAKWFIC